MFSVQLCKPLCVPHFHTLLTERFFLQQVFTMYGLDKLREMYHFQYLDKLSMFLAGSMGSGPYLANLSAD